MATRHDDNEDVPSIREIADLTRRLRALSNSGRDADPAVRAAFLADKDALIARIQAATRHTGAADGGRPFATGADGELRGTEHSAINEDTDDDAEDWSRWPTHTTKRNGTTPRTRSWSPWPERSTAPSGGSRYWTPP